jgi:hypothetical protein
MKLQEQKHYYGLYQMPNHWSDDNDKQYSDEFFNDKKYEDLYFDNFFDMDQMFGHENSLFGTRGLPVGHPKRTSKSFNLYNERFGPMVVRVVKDTNLQEQINRIQSMMGIISEKLEDIQGTPLYHKTSTIRGIDIMNSDSLRGTLPSGEYLGYDKRLGKTKTQTAISFTRDKNWTPNNTIGIGLDSPLEDTGITFVVDKNKLKTKYKVEPFNYHGIDPNSEYKEKFNELEERVMTNEIHPLHKYIIDVIYTGGDPKVQEIINNYLNR